MPLNAHFAAELTEALRLRRTNEGLRLLAATEDQFQKLGPGTPQAARL